MDSGNIHQPVVRQRKQQQQLDASAVRHRALPVGCAGVQFRLLLRRLGLDAVRHVQCPRAKTDQLEQHRNRRGVAPSSVTVAEDVLLLDRRAVASDEQQFRTFPTAGRLHVVPPHDQLVVHVDLVREAAAARLGAGQPRLLPVLFARQGFRAVLRHCLRAAAHTQRGTIIIPSPFV